MNKKIKKICKNCKLYDPDKEICRVVILHEGKKTNIPVYENDSCFFENQFVAEEIQEVKFWVEDPNTGEKSKNGVVKIEYPEGFFGKRINNINEN